MKQFFGLTFMLLCMICFYQTQIQAQSNPFQKLYYFSPYKTGGIKFIHTNYYEIEALKDGGFATLGFVTDTNNISQGVLSRYDCLGNVLWTKLLGVSGSGTNTVMGIAETDSSDLVFTFPLATNFFQASTLIGRVDSTGKAKWTKRIGNNTEFGRDIVRTRDGGFAIAGSTGFYGTDTGADDIYLLKIDANGNILWSKTFGNPNSTYDEAFAITTDSKDNLIVTGRCIAQGTFQGFILKADPKGNPIKFKTYGFDNQRTYAFAVLVDKNDNYLITGSTTILELDHTSSEYDVFLVKVDSSLNTVFTNIYETNLGNDAGSIGEALALGPDGKYIIGVSTFAFTTHMASGPNAPNKNALYSINEDGTINKAYIYNVKGSQYTRVRTTTEGFYISAFSTAYAGNVNFQGLIIKTDKNYLSGCNDIDVTSELDATTDQSLWTVADYVYQSKTGSKSTNYSNYRDSSILSSTICETIIKLEAKISAPKSVCARDEFTVIDSSTSMDGSTHSWILDGQPYSDKKGDTKFTINNPGVHVITRLVSYGCVSKMITIDINVIENIAILNEVFCEGKPFKFNGIEYSAEGSYKIKIPGSPCDTTVILNLKESTQINNVIINDTIYCQFPVTFNNKTYSNSGTYYDSTTLECIRTNYTIYITSETCNICLEFPNIVTPGDPNENNKFRPVIPKDCKVSISEIDFKIYNRWGAKVYESNDVNLPGWDGMYKNNPSPTETYMYQVIYKLKVNDVPKDQNFQHKGMFTLVR